MEHRTHIEGTPSPSQTSHGSFNFLGLPDNVRLRVYLQAGLFQHGPIDLNPMSAKEGPVNLLSVAYDSPSDICRCFYPSMTDGHYCSINNLAPQNHPWRFYPRLRRFCTCELPTLIRHQSIPVQLLHTSRAISQEATLLFYSENAFQISLNLPGGLSALRQLRPSTLACMKSLQITLQNSSDCLYNAWVWDHYFVCSRIGPPLRSKIPRILKDEWRYTCKHLSRHIEDSRLQLSVICDVNGRGIAEQLLKPLMKLPTLASFAIRLHPSFNERLDRLLYPLGRDIAMQLTGRSHSTETIQPFRYGDLPLELQERILHHTDLVSPYDLVWTPTNGFRWDHLNRNHNHCSTCLSVRDRCCWQFSDEKYILARQCSCWRFPLSMFLANRDMHDMAMRIFYSMNHFKLLPYSACTDAPYSLRLHKPLSPFIDFLPVNALKHLRSVQFVFDWQCVRIWEQEGTYKLWQETVEKVKLSIPARLHVTVDMSHSWVIGRHYWLDDRWEFNPWLERARFQTHCLKLINPLIYLRLKSFQVYLPCNPGEDPWGSGDEYDEYDEDDEDDEFRPSAQDLEQMVMGNGYHNHSDAKYGWSNILTGCAMAEDFDDWQRNCHILFRPHDLEL
ncbi:hypothetical protein N7474_010609 [Penicillium riverlandense]|uniref:uncharacterized protein n=1 Tax=Penicillium riverlandense TaxID=1903569 RepID=UPI0025473251|nr:uncharacterized protein N7474_010609 [Penicillium riverlandense]KAJ5807017.1 hypothetical protein N7474_010609 [Penicillium riverlandense]